MKGESLNAELIWFHVFKAMIDNGELKKWGQVLFQPIASSSPTPISDLWRDVPILRKNDAMKTKPTRYELDLNNLPPSINSKGPRSRP